MPIATPEVYAAMLDRATGSIASCGSCSGSARRGWRAGTSPVPVPHVIVGEVNEKLYSTAADALLTAEALGTGAHGRYLLAATFGNVHGVYQPGHVKLRPKVLREIQDTVGARTGTAKPFDLVFHGGSGSRLEEIRETLDYGVVKMNIDTDTQYAFTRPVADHMLKRYDGVLKVDGDVGDKKAYDPRTWGKAAEAGMAARVVRACQDLRSAGTTLGKA